uniref:TnsE C-terminal domain-containing protein n=1 Tax=Hydrogenovibrio crunogenus (strain DSM 25203 / XCL-2) TaxID=317025 RepID=Q31F41_HYDCU
MPRQIYYQNVPPIKEFPNGSWTIIWHGKVSRNPNIPSEPLIELHLRSKEKDEIIEVGVGQLPILTIGAHFLNKRLTTGTPDKIENLILPGINISQENIKVITAWEKIEDGKYAINPNSMKIPFSAASTKCLAINYNDDPFGIVIPTSEIARFYFCQSTDLAHSAFWGEYTHSLDQIINLEKCGFDEETDRAIVHLRQHFSNDDAWTIGRILNDEIALLGIQEIHNSLLRGIDTDHSGIFSCGIPYVGITRWIAKGIQMGTNEHPRYLITQLIKCSHPFPFTQLQVSRDNDAGQAAPETDKSQNEKKPYNRPNRQKKSNEESNPLNSESETHKNLPISNILSRSAQFDFIENKEIIKPESKEYNEYKSMPDKPKAPDAKGAGTGQGDYSQNSTNEQAKVKRRNGVGADLSMLTEAVQILKDGGMDIKIRMTSTLPLASSPHRRQWAYLDSGTQTKRNVIAIDIKRNSTHYCWVDIEQRRKGECAVGLLKSDKPIGDEVLLTILKNLSRLKGIWGGSKGNAVSDFNIYYNRVLHTWDSAPILAKIIETKTQKI